MGSLFPDLGNSCFEIKQYKFQTFLNFCSQVNNAIKSEKHSYSNFISLKKESLGIKYLVVNLVWYLVGSSFVQNSALFVLKIIKVSETQNLFLSLSLQLVYGNTMYK